MQRRTMEIALALLQDADHPGAVAETPFRFAADDSWKKTFLRIDDKDPAELRARGEETKRRRAEKRTNGLVRKAVTE